MKNFLPSFFFFFFFSYVVSHLVTSSGSPTGDDFIFLVVLRGEKIKLKREGKKQK